MSTPSTELQLAPESVRMEQVLRLAPSAPQLGLVVSLAAALTLAVGLVMWAARPSMVPLDTELRGPARLDVMQYLDSTGARYEMSDGMLLVPQDARSDVLADLSARGIALRDEDGLLGASNSADPMTETERDKQRRAIARKQLDLAKTIARIRDVRSATVHLAIPERPVFVRELRRFPTASVQVRLAPGRVLDPGQVAGIVNLVANAVPHLKPSNVSIMDGQGRQLNQDDALSGERQKDLSHKQAVEDQILARVRQILDRMVGPGNYQANLDARIDFSRVDEDREIFDEKSGAMVSMQQERRGSSEELVMMGIPGAPTNQPPDGGLLLERTQNGEGGEPVGSYVMKETRNNSPGKTTQRVRRPSWRLERLSLAVLIGDKVQVDEAGEATNTPWEQAELDKISELVKTAAGIDEERGDKISVINQAMQMPPALEEMPPVAMWEQGWFEQVVKTSLAGLALLLLVLLVIRPTARALIGRTVAAPDADGGSDDNGEERDPEDETRLLESDRVSLSSDADDLLPPPSRVHGDILNLAKEMAAQDPKRMATVMKKWMEADE